MTPDVRTNEAFSRTGEAVGPIMPPAPLRPPPTTARLPEWERGLVVVAHPDDESFGLGGVIDALVRSGTEVTVLCLTAGEASTLGIDQTGATAGLTASELAAVRSAELDLAAHRLGVHHTLLRSHPDGGLAERVPDLIKDVAAAAEAVQPDGLLVFGRGGGVTGHPDHEAASQAAVEVAAATSLPVLEWCLPRSVADSLNAEFGAAFTGFAESDLPITVTVDRERQHRAIDAHVSQAVPGSVLWHRLELLGDHEHLRLTHPGQHQTTPDEAHL